jgi:hypothetical protein
MKFTFGHLWIFIGSFMLFIAYLAYSAISQKVDLETDNYYQEEIAYQEVIDKKQNYHNLEGRIVINTNGGSLIADFPEEFVPSLVSGEVTFYCNADKNADFSERIALDDQGKLIIAADKFPRKGQYKVKLDWQYQKVAYFYEQHVNID